VEIDADLSDLVSETSHVMSLINPSNTYMVLINPQIEKPIAKFSNTLTLFDDWFTHIFSGP
jgi:hypothetical protein